MKNDIKIFIFGIIAMLSLVLGLVLMFFALTEGKDECMFIAISLFIVALFSGKIENNLVKKRK